MAKDQLDQLAHLVSQNQCPMSRVSPCIGFCTSDYRRFV